MFCESEEWVNKMGNKENKKNLIVQVPKCEINELELYFGK